MKKKYFVPILILFIIGLVIVGIFYLTSERRYRGRGIILDYFTLTIVSSPWSGWSEKQPDDVKEIIDISENKVINLNNTLDNSDYLLTVNKYDRDKIDLTVDGLSLKQGEQLDNKGIDLYGCGTHTFTLDRYETVELNTCTMDMGTTWKITY